MKDENLGAGSIKKINILSGMKSILKSMHSRNRCRKTGGLFNILDLRRGLFM